MRRYQNVIMIIIVVVLVALPLWMVQKPVPAPAGLGSGIFQGTDDKANNVIRAIAPEYKPWATPIMEPPSPEISSLLFALQAALGAGFIGYYLGMSVTRAKMRRENITASRC
ncbi:MAG: energy-coupling factor ABC transporter substrate-binding protein [Desulfuromonadaceae bacterium]|nr:energy-coupling factor ABC transporter substrate-binding protein [Desulfuromonadaceae bacterium]